MSAVEASTAIHPKAWSWIAAWRTSSSCLRRRARKPPGSEEIKATDL